MAAGCGLGDPFDPDAPQITITSPTADTVSGPVVFSANAADACGVAPVGGLVDDMLLFEDPSSPSSTVSQTSKALEGEHTLKAEAVDFEGNPAWRTAVVVVRAARE